MGKPVSAPSNVKRSNTTGDSKDTLPYSPTAEEYIMNRRDTSMIESMPCVGFCRGFYEQRGKARRMDAHNGH